MQNVFMVKIRKEIDFLLWMTFLVLLIDLINFASFLTTAHKLRYHCIHIFYNIFPEKAIWRSLICQTNIFNIFPVSVPLNSVKKILQTN